MWMLLSIALAASPSEDACPERFATKVVAFEPGPGVEPEWADPATALGAPDWHDGIGAVSLGNQTGATARLTVSFGVPFRDVEGPDLHVYERGPSAEPTVVEVSVDGKTWLHVGQIAGSIREVDLAKNPALKGLELSYVRLSAVRESAAGPWAGPDIDAIGLFGACERPNS